MAGWDSQIVSYFAGQSRQIIPFFAGPYNPSINLVWRQITWKSLFAGISRAGQRNFLLIAAVSYCQSRRKIERDSDWVNELFPPK